MLRRAAFLVFLPLLAAAALGQGSAGGYGRGGEGGGGFGGGAGGGGADGGLIPSSIDYISFDPTDNSFIVGGTAADERNPLVNPEISRAWTKRQAIVTPGEFVEYKFDLKAGEALFATATSDAFDAGLAVVDASGKELAKNDDRAEGDQRPYLAFRAPSTSEYRLRVLSFRSTAGGQFDAAFRTAIPVDLTLGGRATKAAERDTTLDTIVVRLPLKKGATVQLRAETGGAPLGIVGPTGTDANDLRRIPAPTQDALFTAERDGDFYLEYPLFQNTPMDFAALAVPRGEIGRSGAATLKLPFGEVGLVAFPVEVGSLVTTEFSGPMRYTLTAPIPPKARSGPGDGTYGKNVAFGWILPDRSRPEIALRSFRAAGTVLVAVTPLRNEAPPITVENVEGLPLWEDGRTTPKIGIGEARLYRLKSKPSDLLRVYAKSPTFQTRVDIFELDGTLANSLVDRKEKESSDDLYFPEAKEYLVRLTSDGYGGSGEAVLRKGPIPASAFRLGDTRNVVLGARDYGLFEVSLEAGKRCVLTLSRGVRTDLLDPEGTFLSPQTVNFDGTVVQYFVPKKAGVHRLWLRGEGEVTFRFEPFATPVLKGTTPKAGG